MPFPDGRLRTGEAAQQIAAAVGVEVAAATVRRWLNERIVPEPGWSSGRRRERAFPAEWIAKAIQWYRKEISWTPGQTDWS